MWLSRTLPHPIMSERADARSKSGAYRHICPENPSSAGLRPAGPHHPSAQRAWRAGGGKPWCLVVCNWQRQSASCHSYHRLLLGQLVLWLCQWYPRTGPVSRHCDRSSQRGGGCPPPLATVSSRQAPFANGGPTVSSGGSWALGCLSPGSVPPVRPHNNLYSPSPPFGACCAQDLFWQACSALPSPMEVGLGWVGSRLAPEAVPHSQRDFTGLA